MTRPPVMWFAEPGDAHSLRRLVVELDQAGIDAVVLPGSATVDPILLASSLTRRAPRIGLVAALSPWSQPPFLTARALNTLDALSAGRAGWFVVRDRPAVRSTDDSGRWTPHGKDDHELTAARADYLAATDALWGSWEPGAIVADVASGRYVDADKVHVPDHRGPYYTTRGPLNAPPGPQGRPTLVADFVADDPVAPHTDVVVVGGEGDVTAAREYAAVVLVEIGTDAADELPPTTADGYAVRGVSPGVDQARLLHGPLAEWAHSPRAGLLRPILSGGLR